MAPLQHGGGPARGPTTVGSGGGAGLTCRSRLWFSHSSCRKRSMGCMMKHGRRPC